VRKVIYASHRHVTNPIDIVDRVSDELAKCDGLAADQESVGCETCRHFPWSVLVCGADCWAKLVAAEVANSKPANRISVTVFANDMVIS
jgi:hypothetical protein